MKFPTIPVRFKFVTLCILSGLFTALFVAMDVYYQGTILSDPIIYGFLTEVIGLAITFLIMLFLVVPYKKKPVGKFLDPTFKKFIIPRGKLLYYLMGAGLSAAFSTLAYFALTAITDPSTVIPFSKLVIVYLLVAELLHDRDTPTIVEVLSITMIITGLFVMAVYRSEFDLISILIVLGPYNLGSMFYTYFQKLARSLPTRTTHNDSLNLRFWSLFFLTLFQTLMSLPFITFEQWQIILSFITDTFTVVFITINMSFAFFAYVFYIRALGMGKMSIVNALTSVSVIFGIVFTIIGNIYFPEAFGPLSTNAIFWSLQVTGAILVLEGIVALSITQERAYLLIKLKYPCTYGVLDKIVKVKGVTRAAFITGHYAIIARLQIRSIAKVYNTIVREIEAMPEIEKVVTMTIIKEWSKI
ncbi:MAG: Lrp/AsnC family transcriptional regulator [Candidatus Odinarchaeota archaeon]|nr:Lrp/AsnC family transcriptional regulator [Candidatus Odinarchaeota archaeon]